MKHYSIALRWRSLVALGVGLVAAVGMAGPASAAANDQALTPGAVFTQTNTAPNYVAVFNRAADGKLVAAGQVATGGNGQPAGNPPFGLPFADSAGNVELASDGDSRRCLFVTNIGSSTVSSFRVGHDGIELADVRPTGGSRPVSLTSNRRGPLSLLLYVLNSDVSASSIQGYFVSVNCALTPIPGSHQPTADQAGLPAQIAFNSRGTVLSVTQRFSGGGFPGGPGDLNVFPVDGNGVAGAAITSPSSGVNPYGQAWTKHDQLTISNANGAGVASVSSYQLTESNTLVPVGPAELPSPGLACWNVITDNGKFLYITNPAGPFAGGASITTFTIGRDGALASAGPGLNVPNHPSGLGLPLNAIDEALSTNSQYLYVLANQMLPFAGPLSTINQYSVDQRTGALTFIGAVEMPRNNTSGLAAW